MCVVFFVCVNIRIVAVALAIDVPMYLIEGPVVVAIVTATMGFEHLVVVFVVAKWIKHDREWEAVLANDHLLAGSHFHPIRNSP